jgi:hypothetical protein
MANDNVDVTLVATTNAAHLAADIEYASVPYGLPTLGRRRGGAGQGRYHRGGPTPVL